MDNLIDRINERIVEAQNNELSPEELNDEIVDIQQILNTESYDQGTLGALYTALQILEGYVLNANVRSDALIQPGQGYVNASALIVQSLFSGNLSFPSCGITNILPFLTDLLQTKGFGGASIDLSGNPLVQSDVDGILALYVALDASGFTIDLSSGEAPTNGASNTNLVYLRNNNCTVLVKS